MISNTVVTYDFLDRNSGRQRRNSTDSGAGDGVQMARELEALGFLAAFAREIGSSLDPVEVLGQAAKLLYNHFRYDIAVFSLLEGFGGLMVFSPLSQSEFRKCLLKTGRRIPELKNREIFGHRRMGLADSVTAANDDICEVVISLAENCGNITIYCDRDSAAKATHIVRTGISESLTTSLRNAREHDRVKELSLRDGLTGLYNRRVLEEILHLEENKRKPAPTSVLLIDVDDFKKINDNYGHPAGDKVLSVIGKVLLDNTRKENVVARYGGEEFAVLLTNTGQETAAQIAERLRIKLGEQEFTFSGSKLRLSVSIGVATNDGDSISTESLVSRADKALYEAKRSGKDRVCCHRALQMIRIQEPRRRSPLQHRAIYLEGVNAI